MDDLDELKLRTDKATQRADIVILDWNIRPETRPGENARQLIKEILDTDVPSAKASGESTPIRRLRLVAIYTGEALLKPIVDELVGFAKKLRLPEVESNGFTIHAGAVTITVYGKEKGITEGDAPERRVSEKNLPGFLLDDFTKMTSGLLANVALASLSAVRANTHRILSRFGPHIDAPYVAHRAMMEPPEEASEHPVPLVAAEIESILADASTIRKLVDEEAIHEWLESLEGVPFGAGLDMEEVSFKSQLVDLLTSGLRGHKVDRAEHPEWTDLVNSLKNYTHRRAASRLSNELTDAGTMGEEADAEFAMLTSTRSQYDEPKPFLRLGTVVAFKKKGKWSYRLCIQPLCDSVRLGGKRDFPFIRLELIKADEDKPFDFVVKDRRELRRLRVSLKAHEMELVRLSPDSERRVVLASKKDEDWWFETEDDSPILKWIADLKTDFAHRVSHSFAAELSRVGLTESEWLRRMTKKYS